MPQNLVPFAQQGLVDRAKLECTYWIPPAARKWQDMTEESTDESAAGFLPSFRSLDNGKVSAGLSGH